MANLTKNEVKAKLALLISLSEMIESLGNNLKETLSTDDPDKEFLAEDLIYDIKNHERTDLDLIMESFENLGILDNLDEGAVIPLPYVEAINEICIEAGVQYPSGEKLTAFLAENESGTYQAGSIYYTEKGTIFDLSLSEIKKGYLAEGDGLSSDNKDIDIYVWGDAFNEDYTEKIRLSHKDIMRVSEEDDLFEAETPPVLK